MSVVHQHRDGETTQLTLGKWVHGGRCLAHVDGQTWLVAGGLPGEVVDVQRERRARGVTFGDVVRVITASPARVVPPCTYADSCGGCDLQHVSVKAQRDAKRDVVIDALTRIGKLGSAESFVSNVAVLGPEESRRARDGVDYRSRIRLRENETGEWGLFAERSHSVVPVSRCVVCVDGINEAWSSLPRGASVVNVSSGEDSVAISTAEVSHTCERSVRGVDGRTWRWSIPADSFWQVHVDLPQYLVDFVSGYVHVGSVWWDLYGGAGLMSAAAVSAAAQTVHLVERDSRSIAAAKDAFGTSGQVHIHATDVGAWLTSEAVGSGSEAPSGVVLDPPRSGAGVEVISAIARWRPATIIYVACDPASLARDTAALRDRNYGLRVVQPIDAFPMTHHVETIAVFAPGVDRHP